MTVSVTKGRVVLKDDDGKIAGNLDPVEAEKLGLELLDAGTKAAKQAGAFTEE